MHTEVYALVTLAPRFPAAITLTRSLHYPSCGYDECGMLLVFVTCVCKHFSKNSIKPQQNATTLKSSCFDLFQYLNVEFFIKTKRSKYARE